MLGRTHVFAPFLIVSTQTLFVYQMLSLGRCPNPLHFLVLIQENEAKESPNGSAYARHSSNKFGSALAKTAQSRLNVPSRPAGCARSLNVENSPTAQTVRRFSSLTFAQAGLRLGT